MEDDERNYGKSKQTVENEGITFIGRSHTSPKLIANSFNHQFTTSKLGKHSSSRRTRHVSKDVKRMYIAVLTNKMCTAWSDAFFVLASNGTTVWFQRQQPTSGGTVRSSRPENCCQHIPSNRFLDGFPDPSHFTGAKLTYYSSKPHDPRTPRDHGCASCSHGIYTQTLALLQSIHVRCVLAMSRFVG